jgi:hypothetical protein
MFYSVPTNHNCLDVYSESVPRSRATLRICNNLMHMWHHVTNHLIISNDKDSNSENRIKLHVRDNNPTANTWTINKERWIQSVLNLMEGDARTWALPYLEELRTGTIPFAGLWATFIDHFSCRFAPLNTADAARDALKKVQQKNGTVAKYTSLFDQYLAQTGWSLVNLRQRYYNGLNDCVKDRLSEIPTPPANLADLRAATQNIDQRWWQREAEKKGGTITISPSHGTQSDPNAMQVDATCQGNQKPKEAKKDRASYIKSMQGKCYGCGSDKHTKKDGNHERDVCNHCSKTGHQSPVCFNKYIGKAG